MGGKSRTECFGGECVAEYVVEVQVRCPYLFYRQIFRRDELPQHFVLVRRVAPCVDDDAFERLVVPCHIRVYGNGIELE